MIYFSPMDIVEAYNISQPEIMIYCKIGRIKAETRTAPNGVRIFRIPETELSKLASLKIKDPIPSPYVQNPFFDVFANEAHSEKDTDRIPSLLTNYAGITFKSRLEARWAIFFDHCGIEWEYEPEGYKLENGTSYLPDFLLHNLVGRVQGNLFVEVKGKLTKEDVKKINGLIHSKTSAQPLLLVGNIFVHGNKDEYVERCFDMQQNVSCPEGLEFFSYAMIDGDSYGCVLGVNHYGQAQTFGGDYMDDYDKEKTEAAFKKALNAQFEKGKYIDNEARP